LRQIRSVIFEGHKLKCIEVMGQYFFFNFVAFCLVHYVSGYFDVQREGENLCKIGTSVDMQCVHFGSLHN
jgi:hypothetical protein